MKEVEKEPNPPTWPASVILLRDTDTVAEVQTKTKPTEDPWSHESATHTCEHHFTDDRWAILLEPGTYRDIKFQVGYYVQVVGLGIRPDDVQFHNGGGPYVPALNRHLHKDGVGTCLDTFWRSGENFAIHGDMMWAVSQASPLRQVHVLGDLYLHDKDAYASGGHLANAIIDGHTHFGGQQQYLSRNVTFGKSTSGGAWGMVYVGCSGAPKPSSGNSTSAAVTVIESTPVRVEKPYIAIYDDDKKKFHLRVPQLPRDGQPVKDDCRDFAKVRVVKSSDLPSRIQEALDKGKDVVLAPGVYHLDQTIEMGKDGQVLLGLGLATLVTPPGGPCIRVAPGTAGVRIAGVMLEAIAVDPSVRDDNNADHWSMLEIGEEAIHDPGNPNNPIALFDIFVRVGGGSEKRDWIAVDSMVRIHSGHVVGDNLWLWRADHADLAPNEPPNCPQVSPVFWQTEEGEFTVETGIEVIGNDVTIYGLAVEHASGHQTVWKGERGAVYFYQCEFPYDVDVKFGTKGYRGYKIDPSVKVHNLHSPGIYSNFRNQVVEVSTAIEHGDSPNIKVVNPFTVHLDNHGVIESLDNGNGPPAVKKGTPTRLRVV